MPVKALPGLLLLFLLGAVSAGEGPAGRRTAWHLKTSPHFNIYHESGRPPSSIALELERLYSKLRMNISMFAPWLVREKTKVYIHKNLRTYLNGEFSPPRWTKGLAYFAKKTVVVYDPQDMTKLRAVLAHEMTHMCFEGFYGERLKNPPQWLNEGLAVMMEDISYSGEGQWSQALRYFPREHIVPLERFFSTSPDSRDSDTRIGYWYLQAFGVVSYLFRPHMRVQFRNFCALLRKGEKLDSALWKMYRIKNRAELDRVWRKWLKDSGDAEKRGFGGDSPSASSDFKPMEFISLGGTKK